MLPLNLVVIGDSGIVDSCSLTKIEDEEVISTTTNEGGSGGRA